MSQGVSLWRDLRYHFSSRENSYISKVSNLKSIQGSNLERVEKLQKSDLQHHQMGHDCVHLKPEEINIYLFSLIEIFRYNVILPYADSPWSIHHMHMVDSPYISQFAIRWFECNDDDFIAYLT